MPDPDFLTLLTELEENGVRYVLIGGLALLLNGGGLSTDDIDLCIAHDQSNLEALAVSLNKFEPKLRSRTSVHLDKHAFRGAFVTYFTNVGVIQIINRVHGYENFDQLLAESKVFSVKGLEVQVASLEALEKMKSGTGRQRDQVHLNMIRSLRDQNES